MISTVDVNKAELEASAPPAKQAVPFPWLMNMCLELALRDEGLEPYFGVFAWARLLKLWTPGRAVDMQGVCPENVRLVTRGLRAFSTGRKPVAQGGVFHG